MTRLRKLKTAVAALPQEEYRLFREWFLSQDWDRWDREIEADSKAGKLDFLLREAAEAKKCNRLRPIP